MCGIVGAVATRDVTEILLTGLARLEYRGYDSAGIAVLNAHQHIQQRRTIGKIAALRTLIDHSPVNGTIGIAHTRWATHGEPSKRNAHPHISSEKIAIVHNGIIENYAIIKAELTHKGYHFSSDTDSEVIAHLIDYENKQTPSFQTAVTKAVQQLKGAFALVVLNQTEPNTLIAVCQQSPLVIGIGIGEYFLASDSLALLPVTHRFIYLEDGDFALLNTSGYQILHDGKPIQKPIKDIDSNPETIERGNYRHFMQKEMFEQPQVIKKALTTGIHQTTLKSDLLSHEGLQQLSHIKRVQIVACGTSFHAGLVAKYWLEDIAGIACDVEIASELRYRKKIVTPNTLLVTISQSGETADTLAALMQAKKLNYAASLTICNVKESALVRHSDYFLLTHAGVEIGVASTKAFTSQLVMLFLFTLTLAKQQSQLTIEQETQWIKALHTLPTLANDALALDSKIQHLAPRFADKNHTLFLGRGVEYPIALEGALKLKEISYIHAEAYAAGELKHGPLALVDHNMPVISIAPNNRLLEKLRTNLHEVKSRGGQLIVFADQNAHFQNEPNLTVINLPHVKPELAPILYVIPLQLLSYHVALIKGTDVDQPRNLAKSVTVE